jgi:hypothetical protein
MWRACAAATAGSSRRGCSSARSRASGWASSSGRRPCGLSSRCGAAGLDGAGLLSQAAFLCACPPAHSSCPAAPLPYSLCPAAAPFRSPPNQTGSLCMVPLLFPRHTSPERSVHPPTPQVAVRALPALRLTPDPSLAAPDPRYFQTLLGLMNISSPHAAGPSGRPGRPGPPLFLSLPHFCGADASLAAGVEGLQCNLDAHSLFLDVGEGCAVGPCGRCGVLRCAAWIRGAMQPQGRAAAAGRRGCQPRGWPKSMPSACARRADDGHLCACCQAPHA